MEMYVPVCPDQVIAISLKIDKMIVDMTALTPNSPVTFHLLEKSLDLCFGEVVFTASTRAMSFGALNHIQQPMTPECFDPPSSTRPVGLDTSLDSGYDESAENHSNGEKLGFDSKLLDSKEETCGQNDGFNSIHRFLLREVSFVNDVQGSGMVCVHNTSESSFLESRSQNVDFKTDDEKASCENEDNKHVSEEFLFEESPLFAELKAFDHKSECDSESDIDMKENENPANFEGFSKYPLIPSSFPSSLTISQCPITFIETERPVFNELSSKHHLNIVNPFSDITQPDLKISQFLLNMGNPYDVTKDPFFRILQPQSKTACPPFDYTNSMTNTSHEPLGVTQSHWNVEHHQVTFAQPQLKIMSPQSKIMQPQASTTQQSLSDGLSQPMLKVAQPVNAPGPSEMNTVANKCDICGFRAFNARSLSCHEVRAHKGRRIFGTFSFPPPPHFSR